MLYGSRVGGETCDRGAPREGQVSDLSDGDVQPRRGESIVLLYTIMFLLLLVVVVGLVSQLLQQYLLVVLRRCTVDRQP